LDVNHRPFPSVSLLGPLRESDSGSKPPEAGGDPASSQQAGR
jgi:hypothetical protein